MGDLVRFLSLFAAFVLIAGLVIAFTAGRNCLRTTSEADLAKEVTAASPQFRINATSLLDEYLADEEAAAAKYNGKVGIVIGIATDRISYSRPLQQSRLHEWANLYANETWSVRCFWAIDVDTVVPSRYTAPKFVLKGKVEGLNNQRLTIDIHGCYVLSPTQPRWLSTPTPATISPSPNHQGEKK